MASDAEALGIIARTFIDSRDFNGLTATGLMAATKTEWPEMFEQLGRLVTSGKVTLVFASHSINPHIKRLTDLPVDEQLARLANEDAAGVGVYPSRDVVGLFVDAGKYEGRPFTERVAFAEAQLTPIFFELKVLAPYFADPRYICRFSDRDGFISVTESHYKSEAMREKDKVLLETFGIGYDRDKNRVVVAYLRYLADLSPQHQQIWKAHEIAEPCVANSDYARATINGEWPEFHSVYEAFIQEQLEIDKLCRLLGKPPLFKQTFEEDKRPIELTPMLLPTQRQFEAFAHALDKVLSENIDKKFFQGDIELEDRITAEDKSIERRPLGSLTLLQRWLSKYYKDANGNDVSKEIVAPWRAVRDARQRPAHALGQDDYDLKYPKAQDQLLGDAKMSLTKLRLVLSAHPRARANAYDAPDWLDGDKIVFY